MPGLQKTSLLHIILQADFITKLIIFILIMMSVMSLSIILSKLVTFRTASKKNKIFYSILLSSSSIEQILYKSKDMSDNISIRMLQSALSELNRKENLQPTAYTKQAAKDRILQTIITIKNKYTERLEDKMSLVGIIGSNAAFVGLFGMVWSMMNIFQQISLVKHVTINMMAPGIVEAFLVTAIGLFVAISSMISYEFLLDKLEKVNNQISNNSLEIYSMLVREIDHVQ